MGDGGDDEVRREESRRGDEIKKGGVGKRWWAVIT